MVRATNPAQQRYIRSVACFGRDPRPPEAVHTFHFQISSGGPRSSLDTASQKYQVSCICWAGFNPVRQIQLSFYFCQTGHQSSPKNYILDSFIASDGLLIRPKQATNRTTNILSGGPPTPPDNNNFYFPCFGRAPSTPEASKEERQHRFILLQAGPETSRRNKQVISQRQSVKPNKPARLSHTTATTVLYAFGIFQKVKRQIVF